MMNEVDEQQYLELRQGLGIDINNLHKDAQEQPNASLLTGELAAELKAESRRIRLGLDILKAETNQMVRTNPENFDVTKVTESAIASAVTSCEAVSSMNFASIEADLDSDKAQALATAYEHRRSMLKLEAELYVHNYWGDIEVKENDMRETSENTQSQKEEKMTSERKRNRDQTTQTR